MGFFDQFHRRHHKLKLKKDSLHIGDSIQTKFVLKTFTKYYEQELHKT